ncbi:MAG: hypothetical protein ACLPMG_03425 [Terriglobales bacterium]|jgi:hypothetical protein
MKTQQLVKMAAGAVLTLGVIALTGRLSTPPSVQAQDNRHDHNTEASRIKLGFEIAPVPLNLEGKDPNLVGLGSYWVNAVSDCNFCHTSGGPPNFNFSAGGNPYFGQPKKTDPTTYLAGGTDFGPAVPPVPGVYPPPDYWLPSGPYVGPDIITRNLTPDKTGRAEGGRTFEQFKEILRHGTDLDGIHLTCTEPPSDPNTATCIPPPVDGSLLQVMPWPNFQDMTDYDIRAIYEYLSAIPCIDNTTSTPPRGAPNELRNDCGDNQAVGSGNVSEAPHRTRR